MKRLRPHIVDGSILMKPKFELSINSVSVVHELPGTWSEKDYGSLLRQLEFDDAASIPADQLRDYAIMALQDLEDDQAARALVDFIFGDRLSEGKKQNLAEEMTTDRLWEEYPDLGCHERIFNAQILLNQAYPETPQPEINRVEVVLSSLNQAGDAYLQKHHSQASGKSIPEALIVRCLASALPDNSILNRLFDEQIGGKVRFTEAEHILWHVYPEKVPAEGGRRERYRLTLYCPIRWTGELSDATIIECEPFVRDLE